MRELLIPILSGIVVGIITQYALNQPIATAFLALAISGMFWYLLVFKKNKLERKTNVDNVSDLDYELFFGNQDIASKKMLEMVSRSRTMDVLLIRGHTFIGDSNSIFDQLLTAGVNLEKVRVILPDPDTALRNYAETLLAEEQQQVYLSKSNIVKKKLEQVKAKGDRIEFCYTNYVPTFKLIILDQGVFVAPYDRVRRGRDLSFALYADTGLPFYVAYSTHFNWLWSLKLSNNRIENN